MAHKILVVHGAPIRIKEEIGCSISTVRYALRGHDTTDLQKKIRELALKKFAGVIIKNGL